MLIDFLNTEDQDGGGQGALRVFPLNAINWLTEGERKTAGLFLIWLYEIHYFNVAHCEERSEG